LARRKVVTSLGPYNPDEPIIVTEGQRAEFETDRTQPTEFFPADWILGAAPGIGPLKDFDFSAHHCVGRSIYFRDRDHRGGAISAAAAA
jgi:hypothetical protein